MLLQRLFQKQQSNAPPKESPPSTPQPEQGQLTTPSNKPPDEYKSSDISFDEWTDEIIESIPVLW